MATWVLRSPSRLELLLLIQEHNKFNTAKTQQIPLELSVEEEFKLRILQQEQKSAKRKFNAVQRSAYSLRRSIEEVLKYNASTNTAIYDRDACFRAAEDFLQTLVAEIEALESLKIAVARAKALEGKEKGLEVPKPDELRENALPLNKSDQNQPLNQFPSTRKFKIPSLYKAYGGEDLPKTKDPVVINFSRKGLTLPLRPKLPEQSRQNGDKFSGNNRVAVVGPRSAGNNQENNVQTLVVDENAPDNRKGSEKISHDHGQVSKSREPESSSVLMPKQKARGILKASARLEGPPSQLLVQKDSQEVSSTISIE